MNGTVQFGNWRVYQLYQNVCDKSMKPALSKHETALPPTAISRYPISMGGNDESGSSSEGELSKEVHTIRVTSKGKMIDYISSALKQLQVSLCSLPVA